MHKDKEIIDKLGGVGTVSKFLGVGYTTVYNWLGRGIPAKVKVMHPDLFMTNDIDQLQPLDISHDHQTPTA